MKNLFVVMTLAFALSATATAYAHPRIQSADPRIEGTLASSPKEVRIRFDEELVPTFSGLSLHDQRGHLVAKGKGRDHVRGQELFLPLTQPLIPGRYEVTWYAVSADTHRIEGHYNFEVKN